MKNEIYNFLVNKHAGISHRYHKVHDGATGIQSLLGIFVMDELCFLSVVLQIFRKSSGYGNL